MEGKIPVFGSNVAGMLKREGSKLSQETHNGNIVVANSNIVPSKRKYIDVGWLQAAAESYHISGDIRDFLIVPVPIITSDIPNRNLQAWPVSELTYFDPLHGDMIYETFKGKPTYVDHDNNDPTQAKGCILDVTMEPIKKYDVLKIIVLTAWDRTKDTHLVRAIQTGDRDSYSMGCYVTSFVCSICNTPYGKDGYRACPHQMNPQAPEVSIQNGMLNYMNCIGDTFFECSSVSSPADPTAWSGDENIMSVSI